MGNPHSFMNQSFFSSHIAALLGSLLCALPLVSCIDDEQPSMEADIEQVSVQGVAAQRLFHNTADAQRTVLSQDTAIVFHLADGVEDATLDSIKLDFRLSQGARIALAPAQEEKFSEQRVVHYVVTSEDGRYQRRYTVQFLTAPDLGPVFNFDHPQLEAENQQYYIWSLEGTHSSGNGGDTWGTGNAGFALSNSTAKPSEYPTTVTDDARTGKAVKLTTSSTGFLGLLVGKPMAAGNLFVGTFNLQKALTDALAATQFGRPIRRMPLRFKGFYKWQPGAQYLNKSQKAVAGPAADGRDLPQVYAVVYRNTDHEGKPLVLDGSNVMTHPNVVAIALVPEFKVTGVEQTSPWASFDVAFDYKENLSLELLAKRGYSLTLVFSSSKNGAQFEGALGSTLIIDDCSIDYQ